MEITRLDGRYKLKYFEHGTFDIQDIICDNFYPEEWLDAYVPEDVRTTLKRAGYLDGYYYGKNLDRERWIDEADWVYVHFFEAGEDLRGQENILCLEGVDTVARVWLNGTFLGMCANMFLPHEFDVTDALLYGKTNRLTVQILSPIGYTRGISREGIFPKEDTTRMLLRKSQMNWGWDFCGHCLSAGLWKSVFLKSRREEALGSVSLTTQSLEGEGARLRLLCEVMDWKRDLSCLTVSLELMEEGKRVLSREYPAKEVLDETFLFDRPRLWWPKPYGEPFLYDVEVGLWDGEHLLDHKRFRTGIRGIQLLQEKDEKGRSFLFCINGRRLFIRGANWVPLNAVYGEIRDEDYDACFRRVLDSNLSMLRVWGGGIYESDHFLDLCDENGILIFQDMMLACGIFPQEEGFLKEVYEEVRAIVKKYLGRTCMAVWSADNELDEAYRWYEMLPRFKENKVNREAVRRAVEETDLSRPFLVSCPCSPFEEEPGGDDPNSDLQGDMHLYLTRFVKENEYYYKKILEIEPRFMSEYGFCSLPWEPSYYRFNFRREKLELERNPWLAHLDWFNRLQEEGRISELIYATQFTHAEALKYWIEYLRSLKWHCGGSLYWKFNDPVAPNREDMLFPTLMSCLDFYGLPKLAYYYARRAYEDRILAFREDLDGNLYVYGCSELDGDLAGRLHLEVRTYGGDCLWQEDLESVLPGDGAALLYKLSVRERNRFPEYACYVYAAFLWEGGRLENRFHFTDLGGWEKVSLPEAHLNLEILSLGEDWMEAEVWADTYAQDMMLSVLDEDVYFSDNGFCLEGNRRVRIQVKIVGCAKEKGLMRLRAVNGEAVSREYTLEKTSAEAVSRKAH